MRYRKKPVEVEALRLDGNYVEIAEWIVGAGRDAAIGEAPDGHVALWINTLEGQMRADPGDYIIRGVQGEFYPCKPDVFEATYEAVEQ